MRIIKVHVAPAMGGFFYDDQLAIRSGVKQDGFCYLGSPLTAGFSAIRVPALALGVGLTLEDGCTVWGDMVSVQYCGGGGREPVFEPEQAARLVRRELQPRLVGMTVRGFQAACEAALAPLPSGPLPLAVKYGISQALLRAAAHSAKVTMAEEICTDFQLPLIAERVPLYAQSGDARAVNVDKMILKKVDILPHGLINSRDKFGAKGEEFLQFVEWVARRVEALGSQDYVPTLHFDVYGWIGLAFDNDIEAIVTFLARAGERASPFQLQIEAPADFGSRTVQIERYAEIVARLASSGCSTRIVVDEWCNTAEDIEAFISARAAHLIQIKMPDVGSVVDTVRSAVACKAAGIGAYVGGSCVETDLSAQVSVHVAVAAQADMLLAKPGMGVDEALSIVGNEQNRLLTLLHHREQQAHGLTNLNGIAGDFRQENAITAAVPSCSGTP